MRLASQIFLFLEVKTITMSITTQFKSQPIYAYILCLSVQWFCFVFKSELPPQVNAVVFMGSSLLFGILIIKNFYNKKVEVETVGNPANKIAKIAISIVGVLTVISSFIFLNHTISLHEITVQQSDVIPSIIEICNRFVDGAFVYAPIEKFGYHLPVTYLPMQWIPFLVAKFTGLDYRWIPISIWTISFLFLIKRSFKFNTVASHFISVMFAAIPVLLMSISSHALSSIMSDTVEVMVAGYYLLLVLSFSSKSPILRGLIVGICLMSRYSLVLWLPAAMLILWLNEPKRNFYLTASTILIFILGIYILPFLSKDWGAFYRGYKYYDISAAGEWQHINPGTGKPYHLFAGFGFASFIYDFLPNWDVYSKVKLIQRLHFFGSIFTTLTLILVYLKIKNKINYKVYLMASFKIYLAIFMFLIQVPYAYLMLVDLMVSIALFAEIGKYRISEKLSNCQD